MTVPSVLSNAFLASLASNGVLGPGKRNHPSALPSCGTDAPKGPVQLRRPRHLEINVELERFMIDDYDLNYSSAGIVWRF